MKRIGVLGGSSDQSTADYYGRLNRAVNQRLGGWNTADLIIASMNFAFSASCVHDGRWSELGAYLAREAAAVERAGASLLICTSNTLHLVADQIADAVTIPLLHIAEPTAAAITRRGMTRVALLGTKPVMSGRTLVERYERHGIEVMVPSPAQQDEVHRIIYDELCLGRITAASRGIYLSIIDDLASRGAAGVILGCTEIPLLVTQADRPDVPMFDTTGLHVEAAVDAALADQSAAVLAAS